MILLLFPQSPSVDPLWNLLKTLAFSERVHRAGKFFTVFSQLFSQDLCQFVLYFSII
jgi:hypothetical protein